MTGFDPYLIWLDIPPHERPATYYRLLGLRPLENDPQVISAAADRVIAHVSRFQQTEHAAACSQLLAELNVARTCLLDPGRKQAYDSGFATGGAAASTAPVERPLPRPAPIPGGDSQSGPAQERQISETPQVPGATGGERQIAQSPAVPSHNLPSPGGSSVPTSVSPTLPNPTPTSPAPLPTAGGEQPLPSSVMPAPAAVPQTPTGAPPDINLAQQPTAQVPSSAPQPPAWAGGQRTGEVQTVIAGQGAPAGASPEQVNTSRTRRGRQLRRQQQNQSAYMLVGIAMALVVFFFGAVLLLAIYLGG